jgi:hypothetical protein
MEVAGSTRMLVTSYKTIRCHNPEEPKILDLENGRQVYFEIALNYFEIGNQSLIH